jgi:polyribonucleotide nucleotidyltransferase
MITKKRYSLDIAGKPLTITFSSIAEQATSSLIAQYGDTIVLVAATMGDKDRDTDFMPLQVEYEERFYAAGKIMGSRFVRREGRPSEEAVLGGRLVDRAVRPLFDHRLRREIQVVITVLQYDEEHDPDFVAMIGASCALAVSPIPWGGPIAGVRVAKIGTEFIVNPTVSQMKDEGFVFETFAAGPKGRINMIEFGGKEATEADALKAFALAQKEIDALVAFQNTIVSEVGAEKAVIEFPTLPTEIATAMERYLSDKLEAAVYQPTKLLQKHKLSELHQSLIAHLETVAADELAIDKKLVAAAYDHAIDDMVHRNILDHKKRPDGRKLDEVRALNAEVGLFSRNHGSALFIRGNTQALAVTTLAAPGQEQMLESIETNGTRRFLLHYNFPKYSVGETGPFRGPGRREIGHGALAKKAIESLIPTQEEFPYTVRVVSEVLSSNGSSSQATICASILSLMDAGVPIKKPAAGIAMGLVLDEQGRFEVLTDIQGPEDHYGDMDFKVAGTRDGITAIQLDVKTYGLTAEIIEKTLIQSRAARTEILTYMESVLPKPRTALSPFAPKILQTQINPEKIGIVIGPGGKMVNGLIRKYKLASIDIEEDGRVFVASSDLAAAEAAMDEIKGMTREFTIGEIVEGTVVRIMEFGAIIDLGGGSDGMVHVSELKNGYVKDVRDVLKMGDLVKAKVVKVEDGKIGLSIKQLAT